MVTPLFFIAVLLTVTSDGECGKVFDNPNADKESDHQFWYDNGKTDIKEALEHTFQNHVAKNVIIFLGDGMGVTVNTAGRIYKGQKNGQSGEEGFLAWERFPALSLSKTYCVNKQVPDSACTGTSYLGGVKTNYYTLGVDANVKHEDCQASRNEETHVPSVLAWAQEAGKDTGVVTTARITHATPGATYAHSASRKWECDTDMLESETDTTGCKDIARQLIEDMPGRDINVLMGGARGELGANLPGDELEVETGCNRTDGRNLVEDWEADKEARGATYKYVNSATNLNELDASGTDFILGLFAGSHNPFEYYRKSQKLDVPSLKDMALAAVKRLSRSEEGYFLLVEGGRIDLALHQTKAHLALEEVLGFDEAISAVMEEIDLSETLVIVTADHSHTLTINGYPERGNDILGTSIYDSTVDKKPHTTLMFANGEGSNLTDLYYDNEKGEIVRPDLTDVDTTNPEFISPAYLKVEHYSETHGGEDVAVYATGPMSHLFHSVHEQTYIAHVMGYAACMGPFKDDCAPKTQRDKRASKFRRS